MLPNTRQWVATDIFIAGAALSVKKLDVILTSDKNTFKLIADALELPCLTMFQADFPKDLFGEIAL